MSFLQSWYHLCYNIHVLQHHSIISFHILLPLYTSDTVLHLPFTTVFGLNFICIPVVAIFAVFFIFIIDVIDFLHLVFLLLTVKEKLVVTSHNIVFSFFYASHIVMPILTYYLIICVYKILPFSGFCNCWDSCFLLAVSSSVSSLYIQLFI